MEITNINHTSTPQFRSKFVERLKEPANLKKPFEKMTKGDCHYLSSYLYSLKFRMGITQEEIKNLLSKNGEEFLTAATNFLKQKMGFSDNNFPPIMLIDGTLCSAPAAFSPEQNIVYLLNSYDNIPKTQLFGLLRHEYQHAIQNHNILRTEGLGEKAVEYYADKIFNNQKDILLDFAKKYSVKELLEQGLITDIGAVIITEMSSALQKNDMTTIDNTLKQFRQSIVAELNEFREKLIQEKGLIKADSKAAAMAKVCFDEFKNIDYYDENGNVDVGKHSFKATESEAELAQIMAESELSQTCFIKLQKNNIEKIFSDKAIAESIDKEFEKYNKN